MLYYNFKDYEGFKSLFGIIKHGNEKKSRKNKILLAYLKDKKLLHRAVTDGDYTFLHISGMGELKNRMEHEVIRSGSGDNSLPYSLRLMGKSYCSSIYEADGTNGLCEDGDLKAIRYYNHKIEKTFKMKAGKLYRHLIFEIQFGKGLPEQVTTYLCEEFSSEWQSYTMGKFPKNRLHVDKDFEKIYSSYHCRGDFHSCMVDRGFYNHL